MLFLQLHYSCDATYSCNFTTLATLLILATSGAQRLLEKYFLVMLGGASGSLARYVAGGAIMNRFGGRFPLGTLVINVTGSFLIGLLMALFTERLQRHPNWRFVLVVGFLGGYTTFSAFEYETYS